VAADDQVLVAEVPFLQLGTELRQAREPRRLYLFELCVLLQFEFGRVFLVWVHSMAAIPPLSHIKLVAFGAPLQVVLLVALRGLTLLHPLCLLLQVGRDSRIKDICRRRELAGGRIPKLLLLLLLGEVIC